jgi:multidrug efflux system membrane fusion protein
VYPSKSALFFLILAALAAGIAGCGRGADPSDPKAKGAGKKGGGDVPVTVVAAARQEVPIELNIIGNVEASSTVSIKPQLSGELVKVLFREGDFVTAGQPLFEIDRRTLEAQLALATANLARSEAQNRQAQANLQKDLAQAKYLQDYALRIANLAKEGVFSKEQAEQSAAQAQAQQELTSADRAAIESTKADQAANRATIENIKVQLGFTTIKAPINGRSGTIPVKQGNIVTANQTELTAILQVEPVFVSFAIPESQLRQVAPRFGKEKIEVFATLQDGTEPHTGLLTFYENSVDPTTGTLKLRATFPNSDHKMWPGQFVRVRMRLGTIPDAIVLPNQAVQTGQDGQFVYVVKSDQRAESRPITTPVRSGQLLVVSSGLEAGETVVLEGQLRLTPGARVSIRTPGGDRKGGLGAEAARKGSEGGRKGGEGAPQSAEGSPRQGAEPPAGGGASAKEAEGAPRKWSGAPGQAVAPPQGGGNPPPGAEGASKKWGGAPKSGSGAEAARKGSGKGGSGAEAGRKGSEGGPRP